MGIIEKIVAEGQMLWGAEGGEKGLRVEKM